VRIPKVLGEKSGKNPKRKSGNQQTLVLFPPQVKCFLDFCLGCRHNPPHERPFSGSMMQTHPIAILVPLAVGIVAVMCTIMIHALPLSATVNFVRRERKRGRFGMSFWIDMGIIALALLGALAAHLIEIALWAVLYLICGEFADFATAYYHSAVNYTSLGYGDIIMSPSWKLLGPLETANGMLLFGVSTAMLFAVIQRLIEARFVDLKN
jgi:Ion channel